MLTLEIFSAPHSKYSDADFKSFHADPNSQLQ